MVLDVNNLLIFVSLKLLVKILPIVILNKIKNNSISAHLYLIQSKVYTLKKNNIWSKSIQFELGH